MQENDKDTSLLQKFWFDAFGRMNDMQSFQIMKVVLILHEFFSGKTTIFGSHAYKSAAVRLLGTGKPAWILFMLTKLYINEMSTLSLKT